MDLKGYILSDKATMLYQKIFSIVKINKIPNLLNFNHF